MHSTLYTLLFIGIWSIKNEMYRTNVHSSMSFNDCLQPCNQHDCNRRKIKEESKRLLRLLTIPIYWVRVHVEIEKQTMNRGWWMV